MASFRLSDPLAFGKFDDKLEAVDGYKLTTSVETLNKAGLTFTPTSDMLSNYINVPALGKPIIDAAREGGKLEVNQSALKDGIIAANSSLNSALNTLKTGIKDGLTVVNGLKSEINATINGITSTIKAAELSTLSGISSAIGSIANNTGLPISFKDVSGLTGLSTNLLSEATKLGIPSAYTQFALGIGNNNILAAVTKSILPQVAKSCNLNMLAQIANGDLNKVVGSLVPGISKTIVSSFNIQNKLANKIMNKMCSSAINSLVKIDPMMQSRTINGTSYPSLDIAANASPSFGKLLASTESYTNSGYYNATSILNFKNNATGFDLTSYQSTVTKSSTDDNGVTTSIGLDSCGNTSTIVTNTDGTGTITHTDSNAVKDVPLTNINSPSPTSSSLSSNTKTIVLTNSVSYSYFRATILETTTNSRGYKVEYTMTKGGQYCKIVYTYVDTGKNLITTSNDPLRPEEPIAATVVNSTDVVSSDANTSSDTNTTVNNTTDGSITTTRTANGTVTVTDAISAKNENITSATVSYAKASTVSNVTNIPTDSTGALVVSPELNLTDMNRVAYNASIANQSSASDDQISIDSPANNAVTEIE